MPALLVHDFFGRDALGTVSGLLGFSSDDERDAFLLGSQGPDPFFYLVANPLTRKDNLVGSLMHGSKPARLLVAMREAYDRADILERSITRAYVAGFLCHYLLDREVHPLVYATTFALCDAGVSGLDHSAESRVHEEIERDFDEMALFTKTGETVETYRPYERVLHGSAEVLGAAGDAIRNAVSATYGRAIDPWAFSEAVNLFRIAQRVLYSPEGTVRETIGGIERAFTGADYSLVVAMTHRARRSTTSAFDNRAHKPWENPFTHEVKTDSFWDLYQAALAKVEPAEQIFFARGFDEAMAHRLTHDLNFSGAPAGE